MSQTLLITGANRGIGLALTRRYLENGDRVIATCRTPDKAEALQRIAKDNANLSVLPLDVTDAASIKALVTALGDTALDILINNAGIFSSIGGENDTQTLETQQALDMQHVLEINAIAPVMVTQALLPLLRRGTVRKIAMISSRTGSIAEMSATSPLAYAASKAALNAATKIISSTLQNEQFVVVTLNPGWVRTDMGGPQANLAPEESAARLGHIIDALTPDQNGHFISHTGENIAW